MLKIKLDLPGKGRYARFSKSGISWKWKKYDALAARFIENFKLFADGTAEEVKKAGPVRLKT